MTTPRFPAETVLVTGGAGFVGSHIVRHLLRERPRLSVIVLDALTYAGDLARLADVTAAHGSSADARLRFVHGDVRDAELVGRLLGGTAEIDGMRLPRPDALLHLAAETHVDRSIIAAAPFVAANVEGTVTLLEALRRELVTAPRPFRFVHAGTDEVYGALGPHDAPWDESAPLRPSSPYAASKAAADLFVHAYAHTHGVPAVIMRSSNSYGPWQYPEKLIPLMVVRALRSEPLPLFGDGTQVRDWIHVRDAAAAFVAVLEHGRVGETYNVGAADERVNLEVVRRILHLVGRPESLLTFASDRAGHDRRYGLDAGRARRELGWEPHVDFERGLEETVAWYAGHSEWWERLLPEAYRPTRELYLRTQD